ncbi:MAG TPA: DUF6069 family protein [Cryptosporangiaceae bacterium]|nr:DUF6069 family protein [Cryptosporangiaceae bacterium]
MTSPLATTTTRPPSPVTRRVARRVLVVVAAVVAAVVVWTVAVPVLGTDVTVPQGPGSGERTDLALAPVVATALVAGLLGWALLAMLERFTRRAHAVWTGIALTVLVFSMPWMPGFTGTERIVLVLLHLAVAAVLVPGPLTTGQRPVS